MSPTKEKPRVAFQGEHGAFSEEAALKLLGHEIELVPRRTFADLYESLDSGVADYLLAPVENSIAGVVRASVDLLNSKSLDILNEIQIKIEQHLIGCPGASFEAIETVQSHPTALAQCSRFFESHPQLQRIVADDTAGSVAEVMRRGDPTRAAIAGQRAAELYCATILRKSIQDSAENYTRFVLLSASTEQKLEPSTLEVKEYAS
jgi:prephenate dehydratase